MPMPPTKYKDVTTLCSQAEGWLQDLLRCDSSNPPGNEQLVIDYVAKVLSSYGIPFQIVAEDSRRPNLVATLKGSSSEDSILLSSHADVVPVRDESEWTHPPFAGIIADDVLWGRGALDMKYKTALDLALIVWANAHETSRTVKMVVVADEEAGGAYGSSYLTRSHLDLINADYVLNELGGFNYEIAGHEYFVIQAGEKSVGKLRLVATGLELHASTPVSESSISLLSRAILVLSRLGERLVLSETSRDFVKSIASSMTPEQGQALTGLLDANHFSTVLSGLPDTIVRAQVGAMLSHTIAPTMLSAGFKSNVIPGKAEAVLDCRVIPTVTRDDFIALVKKVLVEELGPSANMVEVELEEWTEGYELASEDPMLRFLSEGLDRHWCSERPGSSVCSMLMPASSDNSVYLSAGIKPVGFAPLLFPKGFPGFSLSHGVDERIPLESFRAGLRCYIEVLEEYLRGKSEA